jgi:putative phosphoribosyl transferase
MDRRSGRSVHESVSIPSGSVLLSGDLLFDRTSPGIVLFAHGSGSSRHSPRNRFVAEELRAGGLGTLLIDLLSAEEESLDRATARLRFDIGLLANRVVDVLDWLDARPETSGMSVGLFGASTGAAAALVAAARRPGIVGAVVSRGGRPDLAGDSLPRVEAPTLLIVGGHDFQVITLNEVALERLRGLKHLQIVPGATHLFEEPGALEMVASLAREWFLEHLRESDRAEDSGAAPG